MSCRIPLSCVFDAAVSSRHAIPHCTLILHTADPFVLYLDSDDTRLPQHPFLTVTAQPAEEYETYVGEDVWLRGASSDGSSSRSSGDTSDPPTDSVRFDEMVRWVATAMASLNDGDGVVLCGRHVVADDCGWAVPSRTPALHAPRDVFVAMRNSSKFLRDIHQQRRAGCAGGVEITMARALGGDGACEFRAIVPYRLDAARGVRPMEHLTGITQRATDVCLPPLLAWDADTHAANFDVLMHHIREARLLERAVAKDEGFLPRLVGKRAPSACVLLLAVDVLFAGPTLPVRLLSAKVRCFAARDPSSDAPHIREEEDKEEDTCEKMPTSSSKDNAVNHSGGDLHDNEPIHAPHENMEVDEDDDDDEEDEATIDGADSVSFFRLFRDAANWNRHVDVAVVRPRGFFVIASERDDLAVTRETMAKRGLPLEFLRPELMQGSEEFQRDWREKLMQCLAAVTQT